MHLHLIRHLLHQHLLHHHLHLCQQTLTQVRKELSKQNANNRKKQKYHHQGGAMPFIQHARKTQMDNMKKKTDEVMEKLIQEAPEGTIFDSIQVPLEDEFGIMAENLGRKGKSVNGVGLFSRTDTFSCVSSMASISELTDMRDQIKILSDGFLKFTK
ncbi:hypothetical protein C1H46_005543 [Malus baccata]|uniref:Uncharacterized protein n=1 Tax=Malus baccata TaxID=106549 RepID=A0A540NCP9_MALBA|nr:hypothetical protein C1H46_005543 [Malus baccata]